MLTKELRTLLVEVAWTQFRKMPSSNPGDYAAAIARSLDSFTVLTPEEREKVRAALAHLEGLHPMNEEEPCVIYEDWTEALALLTEEAGDD